MNVRAVPDSLVEVLIEAAIKAPSSHNTQPWRFAPSDDGIAVSADRSRGLPVNDPSDRELTISCGAALANLEIAAYHHGWIPATTIRPDPDDPDLLAAVRLTPDRDRAFPGEHVEHGEHVVADLMSAIDTRATTRRAFVSDQAPDLARLLDPVPGTVAVVELAADRRAALADLVADGDRVQFADRAWRRELASWMRPRRRGDGLVVPALVGVVTRAVVSTIDLGRSTARKDRDLAVAAPLLVVVGTSGDEPTDWIEVGRRLQHVLLRAAAMGFQAGFLNQPCQVAPLRTRLQELVPEAGFPQVVVRLGRSTDGPAPAPRRPLGEVLTTVPAEV